MKNIITAVLGLTLIACSEKPQLDVPEIGYLGVVPWGEGGGTDQAFKAVKSQLSEGLSELVYSQYISGDAGLAGSRLAIESELKDKIMLFGAVRSIDGWHKNGQIDYGLDDVRIYTIWRNPAIISVDIDSPINTAAELIKAIKSGGIKAATAGQGSAGDISVKGLEQLLTEKVERHESDSGTNAGIAVANGKADFTAQLLSEQISLIRQNELKPLAVMGPDEIEIDGVAIPSMKQHTGSLRFATTFGMVVRMDSSQQFRDKLDGIWKNLNVSDRAETIGVQPSIEYGDAARELINKELAVEEWASQ